MQPMRSVMLDLFYGIGFTTKNVEYSIVFPLNGWFKTPYL